MGQAPLIFVSTSTHMRLPLGKFLLRPVDPLPRGVLQKAVSVGFANNEIKSAEFLPRWTVAAAPEVGERRDGKEYPAQFKLGETVILSNRITQECFDPVQRLPGFEGENNALVVDEELIVAAVAAE